MKYAAPDTNCLLHFVWLAQIDWQTVLNADRVGLLVFPSVIRELDRLKNEAPSPVTRRRAQAAIKKLWEAVDSGKSEVRTGVSLKFEPNEPRIDFDAHQLDDKVADDRFIASALQFRAESEQAGLTIVTADLGLTLKASGRFSVCRLPDKYRLPEERDATQVENEQLKRKVETLENRLPALDVGFSIGQPHCLKTILPAVNALSDDEIAQRVALAKRQHSKLPQRQLYGLTVNNLLGPTVEQFNAELDRFYADFEKYLQNEQIYRDLEASKIPVELSLRNRGRSPAIDIDIEILCESNKVILVDPSEYPKPPSPPPEPPDPNARRGLEFVMPEITPLAEQLSALREPRVASRVTRSQGRSRVSVRIKTLKHLHDVRLPTFLILVQDQGIGTIGLHCRITCNELSEAVERHLVILVDGASGGGGS